MLALETPDSRNLALSIVAPSPDVAKLRRVAEDQNIVEAAATARLAYGGRKIIVGAYLKRMLVEATDVGGVVEQRFVYANNELYIEYDSYDGTNSNVLFIPNTGSDHCSRLSGVTLKLLAYEKLLSDCPNLRHSVVLVQRCVADARNPDSVRSSKEIKVLVDRIQQRFGSQVIDYQESDKAAGLAELLTLWLMSDVLFHTPVR